MAIHELEKHARLRRNFSGRASVAFINLPGLFEQDAATVLNAQQELHDILERSTLPEGTFVMSAFTGAIIVAPDGVFNQKSTLNSLHAYFGELLAALSEKRIPARFGTTYGEVNFWDDVMGYTFIGTPINDAARIACSAANKGVLYDRSYLEHVFDDPTLDDYAPNQTRHTAVEGKSHDSKAFDCYPPRIDVNLPDTYDTQTRHEPTNIVTAFIVAVDLPRFSADRDAAILNKRFRSFREAGKKAIEGEFLGYYSPGGDGGLFVFPDVEHADGRGILRRLQREFNTETRLNDGAASVEVRIGAHYGRVALYRNAQGVEVPTGWHCFVADQVANGIGDGAIAYTGSVGEIWQDDFSPIGRLTDIAISDRRFRRYLLMGDGELVDSSSEAEDMGSKVVQFPIRNESREDVFAASVDHFLQGLLLDVDRQSRTREAMTRSGEGLQALVLSLLKIVDAIDVVQGSLNYQSPGVGRVNNPLYVARSSEHVLLSFLNNARDSVSPIEAVAEFVTHVRAHEMAMFETVNTAIDHVLRQLDPGKVVDEGRFNASGTWTNYRNQHSMAKREEVFDALTHQYQSAYEANKAGTINGEELNNLNPEWTQPREQSKGPVSSYVRDLVDLVDLAFDDTKRVTEDEMALSLFFSKAMLEPARMDKPLLSTMTRAREAFHACVYAMMEVLECRKEVKQQLGMESMTTLLDDNPFKVSLTAKKAITGLLGVGPSYVKFVNEVAKAVYEIRAHQHAMIMGLEQAVNYLYSELSPDRIERELIRTKKKASPGACWKKYQEKYVAIRASREEVFLDEFTDVYKQRIKLARQKSPLDILMEPLSGAI